MNDLQRGNYLIGTYVGAIRGAIANNGDPMGESEPRYWSFVKAYGEKEKADFEALGSGWLKYWIQKKALVELANKIRSVVRAWASGSVSKERAVLDLDNFDKEIFRISSLMGLAADAVNNGRSAADEIAAVGSQRGMAPEAVIAELKAKAYQGVLDQVDIEAAVAKLMKLADAGAGAAVDVGGIDFDQLGGAMGWLQDNWRQVTGGLLLVGTLMVLTGGRKK